MFGTQRDNIMTMKRSYLILLFSIILLIPACEVVDSITGNDDDNSVVKLYPVLVNGEWGYINENGAIVIEPRLQIATPFSQGYAAVRESWNLKYINKDGEDVIDKDFSDIRPFSDGKAAVRLDGRWGYINKSGNFVVNPRFRQASSFSDGRAFVRSIDFSEYLYIDEKGNEIESLNMPDDLDFIEENLFENGRALVRDDDLYGFIDKTGNTVIDLKYSEALSFSGKLAAVLVSDRWGYIDASGNVEVSPQFISAGKFGNGLAPARKSSNQFGFIDTNGDFIIPEQFDQVRPFTEERAPVFVNNKWTFIDKSGNQITSPKFDEVDPFYNGLARVTIFVTVDEDIEEQYGYINKSGEYVWYPTN